MFTLRLEIWGNLEELPQLDRTLSYDCQEDNATNSVIQDLCEILEETGIVHFKVEGFGQDVWPVDVAIDLASILEQIPEVIDCIRRGDYPFYLDFYEQGIQRKIVFEETDKILKLTCYSGTSWVPSPNFILSSEEHILSMFVNLKNSFVQVVTKLCPELSSSDLFSTWSEN